MAFTLVLAAALIILYGFMAFYLHYGYKKKASL